LIRPPWQRRGGRNADVYTPPDHFRLFQLPVRFALDADALLRSYREVQQQVHPDRFVTAGDAQRRVALQWAARANEAFQTLRSPLRRAAYLCELNGVPIAAETNTAMPAQFLADQLEWREALAEAIGGGDAARLQRLHDEVGSRRAATLAALEQAIDRQGQYELAATLVRELMFIEKFQQEVDAARVALQSRVSG
jgi:molecular chaperone HscB